MLMIKQNGKYKVNRLYIHHTAGFLQSGQTLEDYAKWMHSFHKSKWPNECRHYAGPHYLIGKDGKVVNTRPIELAGVKLATEKGRAHSLRTGRSRSAVMAPLSGILPSSQGEHQWQVIRLPPPDTVLVLPHIGQRRVGRTRMLM